MSHKWNIIEYLVSERAFSGGGLTGTSYRNSLSVSSFEALQLLKSSYRNGHISASDDASKHLVDIFDTDLISNPPSIEV